MKFTLIKFFGIVLFCVLTSTQTFAQYRYPYDDTQSHVTLQLQMGTQGVGGDLRYAFDNRISVRGGASFIPVKADNLFTFSGFEGTTSASVKFSNVHLLADFVPFQNARGFRLVGGAGYLYKANGGISLLPTGNYKFGNYNIDGNELGQLNMNVSWKGIAPYLGIGLFKSVPGNRFNVNFDLGTYYLSQPQSQIVGTNLLSDNYKLEPQLNSNIKNYRWLPVLQINFNFKIQ